MKNNLGLSLLFGFVCWTSQALAAPKNVIFLTVDGVRWQDTFNPDIFPYLNKVLKPQGQLHGNHALGDDVLVGNPVNLSLPGYQVMMSGQTQPCDGNNCGNIQVQTLPEYLIQDQGFAQKDVAIIASWEKIAEAAEQKPGTAFVSTGLAKMDNPFHSGLVDSVNEEILANPPPWHEGRYDRYTFQLAREYLKTQRPRFLWISLGDSDEWAHLNDRTHYEETLKQYDANMEILMQDLQSMGEYGANTVFVIAADHGRADGDNWRNHGPEEPEARFTWIYYRPVNSSEAPKQLKSLLDIRPLIQSTLLEK